MDMETSPFETCEMLATFLSSTPLIQDSWKLCDLANSHTGNNFLIEQVGDVTYVAFSGAHYLVAGSDPSFGSLVSLDNLSYDLFTPLRYHNEGEQPVMLHAGLLHLFLSMLSNFANQISRSNPVIFTGHSLGGGIASLAALWLLSLLQSESSTLPVLCITFGSPLLGNQSLSRVIACQRWGGNFCHVVSPHDLMPSLLFAPLESMTPQLHCLLQFWHYSSLPSTHHQLTDADAAQIFNFVLANLALLSESRGGPLESMFWPFGNYFFCSQEGAICIEKDTSVIKMMHLMLVTSSYSCSIHNHLKYGDYVGKLSFKFFKKINVAEDGDILPRSRDEQGLTLALQSAGIPNEEPFATSAKDCLKMARPTDRTPNLAIMLSKVNPYRAEIEWYKAFCDSSDDQLGYYDSFKQRGASKRDAKVNMNRLKLAQFWDQVIYMMENNQLPYDFHRQGKWVNGSQFYQLLVEPLDIAEYYRRGSHLVKGHYLQNGRERRHLIFDKWWKERVVREEENNRSRFASLTQDTCFWARVEEARDLLDNVTTTTNDAEKMEKLHRFDKYARELVERKEVSVDVLAKNSSYSLWMQDYSRLKSQMVSLPPHFPSIMDVHN